MTTDETSGPGIGELLNVFGDWQHWGRLLTDAPDLYRQVKDRSLSAPDAVAELDRRQDEIAKTRQDGISILAIREVRPSPENNDLYGPVDPSDEDVRKLSASIAEHGVLEPLVVTIDGYIVSGHRRHAAALVAGLAEVPCRILPIRRRDDVDAYTVLLREHNRQRNKTFAQKLREELVTTDPTEAHERLVMDRATRGEVEVEQIELNEARQRATISKAKMPMVEAIKSVLEDRRQFWPLSDRQIHYALLNDPPLRHASKRDSRYQNTKQCYGDLCDLLTRARLAGLIPFDAIADETRPVALWKVYGDPQSFLRDQLDDLLQGYYRDLLQSQPNHIEVLIEKNTAASICRPICERYCLPMTSGRGFCSLPPRRDMAIRYKKSGKQKLVLLIVSDFDPEGEVIAESFARSMRDDFGVYGIHPIKVALTSDQIERYNLPPEMTAKAGSSNRKGFVDKHGENVWEVEALAPETLQSLLDEAIRSVLDLDAFNREIEAEKNDAAQVESARKVVVEALKEINLGEGAE
ncbi:MAG: ParB/RepB/Spo0J family partition protein [Pirellulaceae bacterium]|nr:ParB/RepB/Spo0J family partition protein [Pirellulaceae bacterium]